MQVIATAGHVDHGKSTLVRELTGMEPDRWAEERRRGMTIDLGFAWTRLGGTEVAFVDVPGHERFVPNMLAGVGPVPAALFVVAADEGWRAQSTEHLAALDALGVTRGVLAVTRADLADPAAAQADALARLAATSLGAVPAVAVSAPTGAGMADLRAALAALAGALPAPDPGADVRLWVDRAFTIRGAGTVVTGTLPAGTLRPGDELRLAVPGDAAWRAVRVRAVQALGRPRDAVAGVARVAVNLRGADHRDIPRGSALLAADRWLAATAVDVALRGGPVSLPQRLILHVGAAAVPVRVRPLATVHTGPDGSTVHSGPGARAVHSGRFARLLLERALPLRYGDRGLLRDPGRHAIAAGVTVLDVRPPALTRRGAAARRAADLEIAVVEGKPDALAALVLRTRGYASPAELAAAGLPRAGTPAAGGALLVDAAWWAATVAAARPAYDRWRAEHPVAAGMPERALRHALGDPDPALLHELAAAAHLTLIGGLARPAGPAAPGLPPALERAVAAVEAELAATPFVAPEAYRLAELHLGTRELAAAERAGRLLRIGPGIVLLPDAPDRAADLLAALPQPFTLSQARQALGTTRRVAVPLLERLDRAGYTTRLADDRREVSASRRS